MLKIIVIGEILVEIMADAPGCGFSGPMALTGPFPSGAPAIFVDQAARLGQPCAILSAVGDDDFGRLSVQRLARDGVDVSGVAVDVDRPTGSAFVRYRPDGARDFVFNLRHSACGVAPSWAVAARALEAADHLHVMGSSLSSPDFLALNLRAAAAMKARGATVSFDPNLRREMLSAPGLREGLGRILDLCDLFLPSGDELLLGGDPDGAGAVARLLAQGVRAVVHKNGAAGVTYHDARGRRFAPAFRVAEVDPTGAGDCFGGAFTAMWLRGGDIDEMLTLACAAGAVAVTRRGPMEGALPRDALDAFVAGAERRGS